MGITRNTFLALGVTALLLGAGCGDEKVSETTVPEAPAADDAGSGLPAGVENAIEDVQKQAEDAAGDAAAKINAAKEDVAALKVARKADVQALKAEMADKIAGLEAQLKADPMKAAGLQQQIADLTAEYERRIDAVRTDYKQRIDAAE